MAFIGGNPWLNIGRNRLLGFEQALKDHGIPINPEWIVHGGYGKDDGYEGLVQLHKKGKVPEFIFAATYPIALGIYEAAKVLGLNIPDDIDLICFGDSDMNHLISPSLSCISQPTRELGTKAVQMILEIIKHPDEIPERHVEIPTELILRDTCSGKKLISHDRKEIEEEIATGEGTRSTPRVV